MTEKCKIQINFKGGVADLINVYADSPEELGVLLGGLNAHVPDISHTQGVLALQGGGITPAHVSVPQFLPPSNVEPPRQPAFNAPQQPLAEPAGGPACQHGTRVWKSGTSGAGKAWKGWFCPVKDGCAPQWG